MSDRRSAALLREGLVIIASILIAFAIDAWWDARQERDRTEVYLSALADDFRDARAELDRAAGLHEGVVAAADALMRWEAEGADPDLCADLRDEISWMLAYPTFDPARGTVETILGSGRVDLIDDPGLIREITRWTSLVDDIQREEAQANEHLAEVIVPMVQEAMDLKHTLDFGQFVWTEGVLDPVPCAFLADRTFQSAVYRHWTWHSAVLLEVEPLRDSMDGVLERISDEVDG